MWVYFRPLYSVPLIYVSVSVSVLCCFDYCSFVAQSEVRKCGISSFVLFFKIALAIQDLLWFHMNFRIVCSSSVENVMGILIGIALNLQTALGNMAISSILILPVQEPRISFHFFVSSSISFINVLQFSEYRSFTSWLSSFLVIFLMQF